VARRDRRERSGDLLDRIIVGLGQSDALVAPPIVIDAVLFEKCPERFGSFGSRPSL
jgi:hypothetical protein